MKQDKGKTPAANTPGTASKPETLFGLIAKQPFFKGLTSRQLQLLAGLAMEREFKAGEVIVEEGDPANRFYLILTGKVELQTETSQRNHISVQLLGPGDDLGWSWLFPPYYFRGTALAIEPTKTIFFYGTRLRQKCEEDHDLGYEIMKRVAQVAIQHLNAARRNLETSQIKKGPAKSGPCQ